MGLVLSDYYISSSELENNTLRVKISPKPTEEYIFTVKDEKSILKILDIMGDDIKSKSNKYRCFIIKKELNQISISPDTEIVFDGKLYLIDYSEK